MMQIWALLCCFLVRNWSLKNKIKFRNVHIIDFLFLHRMMYHTRPTNVYLLYYEFLKQLNCQLFPGNYFISELRFQIVYYFMRFVNCMRNRYYTFSNHSLNNLSLLDFFVIYIKRCAIKNSARNLLFEYPAKRI